MSSWQYWKSVCSVWELILLRFYIWGQLLHLRPTVITFGASYYSWGQLLLHFEPVITFGANCYYIWSQLLHLRPIITLVASTYVSSLKSVVKTIELDPRVLRNSWRDSVPAGKAVLSRVRFPQFSAQVSRLRLDRKLIFKRWLVW